MPSKKQPKHAELSEEQFKALYVLEMLRPVCAVQGQYHRVADDIRRHVAASEKKVKHRPHVAPSLAAEEGAKASEVPPLALSPGLERQAASLSPAISLASPGPSSPLRALSPGGRLSPVTPGSPMRGTASPPLGKLTPVRSMSALGTKSPAARSPTVTPSRSPKPKPMGSKGVVLAAFLGSVALLAVAVAAGIAAAIFFRRKPVTVCQTPGCRRYSEALLASMDSSVDPCQDFGRYVCGRYSHPSGLSVAEAAMQSYRDEVVAPARNASLVSAGQNAMQKGWRFYKSCEDVVEGGVDNIAAVVLGLIESGIGWPVPTAGEVNVFWAMGNLATKMAWPSIVDFVVEEISGGVMQVTLNPSPYTSEVLRRQEKTDVSANEDFFNLAARRIFDATNQLTDNQGVLIHNKASFKDAVNFSTMKTLEKGFDTRFRAKPGTLVILQDDHSYISDAKVLVKRELINTMPGLVRPDHNLTLATNYPALIRWLFRQVIDRPHDVELVLGWHVVQHVAPLTSRDLALAFHGLVPGHRGLAMEHKEYCFDLLKRHFGVASITYMVEHRFTDAVRRDVEAMARNVRRTYFGTLSETTYDWNELGRVLQFLQNSVSAELPSLLATTGDIGDNIVVNVRTMAVNSRGIAGWNLFLTEELASSQEEPFDLVDQGKDVGVLPSAIMFPYYEPDAPDYIRHGTFVTSMARATVLPYLKYGPQGSEPAAFAKFAACTALDPSPPLRDHVITASAVEAASIIYAAHRGGGPDESEGDEFSLPPLLTGLESMSPWQLFYVSLCYLLCTGDGRNSPCSTVLRWNDPFALAFDCPPQSAMRAKHSCHMFHQE